LSAGQRRDATKRAPTASERIVEAARALFVEAGETAVTMRAVAARAKVSPMAAYRHFESREALMHAVMERGHDDFLRRMHHALAAPGPGERLAATGRAYLDFALENPRDYALMFMQSVAGDPCAGAPAWRDAATFRFLVDRIAECTAPPVSCPRATPSSSRSRSGLTSTVSCRSTWRRSSPWTKRRFVRCATVS
jgi:AcrR family transcriptional regulator